MPTGCSFHPRCPKGFDPCAGNIPVLGRPDTPDGAIVSFRVEGDTGFAIWWGIDGKGYAMPLKSEDGAWKLAAINVKANKAGSAEGEEE